MARKENRNTPTVIGNYLYTNDDFAGTVIGSPVWFAWLKQHLTFYYQTPQLSFTARCEIRRHGYFWYAFRRLDGYLHKHYLGRDTDLSPERLHRVAQAFMVVSSSPDKPPFTDP